MLYLTAYANLEVELKMVICVSESRINCHQYVRAPFTYKLFKE